MTRRLIRGINRLALTACCLPLLMAGCAEDKPKVEMLSIEGTIEEIDAKSDGTGSVTVSYFNQKRQEEVVGTGMVTKETELLINGAVATIHDLHVGDRVRSEVRVEKVAEKVNLVALKVYVDRATTPGG